MSPFTMRKPLISMTLMLYPLLRLCQTIEYPTVAITIVFSFQIKANKRAYQNNH